MKQEDYEKLCDEIWEHNRLYFQEGKPTISDEEFDRLVQKLQQIEQDHPEWVSITSPTQRLGEKPLSGFRDVEHSKPMLSLDKAFSKEELLDYEQRIKKVIGEKKIEYSVELKLDGLALSVIYQDGKFHQAITRGDGKIGSDVTQNVKTLKSLPLRLQKNAPKYLEVRGEVFLPKKAFDAMNKERELEGEPLWANARNAAAGSLKLLDPKEVAMRKDLSVGFYGTVYDPKSPIKSQFAMQQYLQNMGLPTVQTAFEHLMHSKLKMECCKKCSSIEEVFHFAKEVEKKTQ